MCCKVLIIYVMGLLLCGGSLQAEPPRQLIFVNNMLLPRAASVEYTFIDGDLVDVMCAQLSNSSCNLKMDYNFRSNYPIPDTRDSRHSEPQAVVGFQVRMGAVNDNTHVICTCSDMHPVRVNFHMKNHPIDNLINVYINDAALRPTTNNYDDYEAIYEYKPVEHLLNIKCANVNLGDEAVLIWYKPPNSVNINKTSGTAATVYVKKNKKEEITYKCGIKSKTNKITVTMKPRYLSEVNNGCSMQVSVSHLNTSVVTNPSLQLYESITRYYIYEYKEDANFQLTCTAKCNRVFKMTLVDSGDHILNESKYSSSTYGETTKVTITRNISKSEIDTNNVFQFYLVDGLEPDSILVSSLVFVPHVSPSATTPTSASSHPDKDKPSDDNEGPSWRIVVIAIVTCAIIIGVFSVICKVKTRKNNKCSADTQPSDINYENLPKDNESPIPAVPRQLETHYAEPMDRTTEPTYCEPCVSPRGNIKAELYTTAIPRTRRKPVDVQIRNEDPAYEDVVAYQPTLIDQSIDDPNYAEVGATSTSNNFKNELNLMYAKVLPKSQRNNFNENKNGNVEDDNPNYAAVAPKSLRKEAPGGNKYVNVYNGRYVNANAGSEYAEPAYCEPTYLNNRK